MYRSDRTVVHYARHRDRSPEDLRGIVLAAPEDKQMTGERVHIKSDNGFNHAEVKLTGRGRYRRNKLRPTADIIQDAGMYRRTFRGCRPGRDIVVRQRP